MAISGVRHPGVRLRPRTLSVIVHTGAATISWWPSPARGRHLPLEQRPAHGADRPAHLVDHVFPPLPVRQWVLSVPKRLRSFLERERVAASVVLNIFLRVVEAHLRRSCPGASAQARFGVRAASTVAELCSIATSTTTAASSTGYSNRCKPVGSSSDRPRH